jgi:hypothetical protein
LLAQSSQELREKLNDEINVQNNFKILLALSDYYYRQGNVDSMWQTASELMQKARETGNDSFVIASYKMLGNYSHLKGDYVTAIKLCFEGIDLSNKIKNGAEILAALYNNIGYNYNSLFYDSTALFYLRKADSVIQANIKATGKDLPDIASYVDENIAESYFLQNNDAATLNYLFKADAENLHGNNKYIEAAIYIYYAKVYGRQNKLRDAQTYFNDAIVLSNKPHIDLRHSAIANQEYSQFYFDNKEYDSAKLYAANSLIISKTEHYNHIIVKDAELLRLIYEIRGEKDSAYNYSIIMNSYKDSINDNQKNNELLALSFNANLKELKANEATVRRHHNIQCLLIAIILICCAIFFILLSRTMYVNEKFIIYLGTIGLLIGFEFINLWTHPVWESFTNDSPILMLLILVIIAAILAPIHHKIEIWIKEKLVKENEKIRKRKAEKILEEIKKRNK